MPRFIPRERKHKIKRRDAHHHGTNITENSNVAEIVPVIKAKKEEDRKRMKEILSAQKSSMSSAKRKRLDKYIDKKLKKEENLDIIKKLAGARVDTSLLKSSKNLGVGKESKRQLHTRALKKDRAGIESQGKHEILYKSEDLESNESDSSCDDHVSQLQRKRNPLAGTIGAGLKRPLDLGDDGNPVIKKKLRLKPREKSVIPQYVSPSDGSPFPSDFEGLSEGPFLEMEAKGTQTDSETNDELFSLKISTDDQSSHQSSDESADESKESEESDEGSNKGKVHDRKERSSAFKAWATQQVNEALGFTPTGPVSIQNDDNVHQPSRIKPRSPDHDPLPPELEISSSNLDRKAFSVHVDRPAEIQKSRLELPVVAEEQKIMEAINNNPAVVIWGATGSGKTTQVPQFLFEAGYGNPDSPTPGMIGVTQPRRVAAVSMANRVGDEMGSASGKVSYQIRFDSTVSGKTAIKYMTDGILIREIAKDFALIKYSAIIIDEAHERSTNTDILIGIVSRIVDLRASMSKTNPQVKPLKLIIMSATLRISDFTDNSNLFRNGPPPLLQAEGRQYPVTIHFARKTQRDYLEEVFIKITRGHKKLPPGSMLVFLTGQNEITTLAKRLKQVLSDDQITRSGPRVHITASEAPLETEDLEIGNEDQTYLQDLDSEEELDGPVENDDQEFEIEDDTTPSPSVHILPLYSQLPTKEQLRVFEPPPENTRLIVLATNVAETSLTIPGIRYVFDCGRAKEKKYDKLTGVQTFEIGWISKASASQRSGRAGRTGPGHCYRLYSSAIYERDFEEYTEPEILRMPVEGVVLQLKSMDLQHVVNFPFPTPPDRQSLAKAEKLLMYLGAVDLAGKVTDIGRDLSIYPLSPRFSKMLLIGHQHDCMAYTIAMVAALVVPDIFIPENQLDLIASTREVGEIYTSTARLEDTAREQRKREYQKAHYLFSKRDKTSEAAKLLAAVCAYAYAADPDAFCTSMFLRSKALKEASQLRHQLSNIVRQNRPGLLSSPYDPRLPEPSEKQFTALKQILAAGFIDQVAIRADLAPDPPEILHHSKPKRVIDVPYLTLFPSHTGTRNGKAKTNPDDPADLAVYIHPSSILTHLPPKSLPQYLIYSSLQRASPTTTTGSKLPKIRMHALTAVSGKTLAALAKGTPLLEYGKPIGKVVALKGRPERRECWVMPSLVGERGGMGWPLGAQKVVQRKGRRGWEVERVVE